jgi:ribulose-5-phosphate 4-epimerase/fuculose-1-phosphate aldolase
MSRSLLAQQQLIREQVAHGSNILGLEDLGDFVLGHVSLRDPDGRGVWMKASEWAFEEITPDRVVLVGWDGMVVSGDGRRPLEYPIHTEIMRVRPDVQSVVHVHAPHATAFAALDRPLRPISHEGTLFVPPDIARFTKTGDLIVTRELGEALAASLGMRHAALMVHHGIVTAGPSIQTAVVLAIMLERACRKQLLAMAAGELRSWSSDDEALAKRAHVYAPELIWSYLTRKLETSRRGGAP